MQIYSIKPLQDVRLINYLQSKRCINIDIAREYCREVHYTTNGKPFFAIGFQSDTGCWELRNMTVCKELTAKHGLYLSSGKENVKREQLREPDATKYRIYDSLVKNVPLSRSWEELERRLKADGVEIGFKTKGSTAQIEGVRFTMNNLTFNGSKVDKQFSYSKIDYALRQNAREECQRVQPIQYAPSYEPHSAAEQVTDAIGGLFDLPFESHGTDPEEEAFRRRQFKKKRQRHI